MEDLDLTGYAKSEERYYLKDELYDLDGDWSSHMHITKQLPDWVWPEDEDGRV